MVMRTSGHLQIWEEGIVDPCRSPTKGSPHRGDVTFWIYTYTAFLVRGSLVKRLPWGLVSLRRAVVVLLAFDAAAA